MSVGNVGVFNDSFYCCVCKGSQVSQIIETKEMMIGTRSVFHYAECALCGCVQLLDPPNDISSYYPDNYYSFTSVKRNVAPPLVKKTLKRLRNNFFVFGNRPLTGLFARLLGVPAYIDWLVRVHGNYHTRVLDIGCGSGQFLRILQGEGFQDLTGVDLYMPQTSVCDEKGFKLLRGDLQCIDGEYDFVMMNHVFEHMEQPQEQLRSVSKLIADNGVLMIRIPVCDSFAWRHYQADWVQLDAPRHNHLQTRRSMKILAEGANLKIESVLYDSSAFQFVGSELYRRNIPLVDYNNSKSTHTFSNQEMSLYHRRSEDLNVQQDGDQACFFLSKDNVFGG